MAREVVRKKERAGKGKHRTTNRKTMWKLQRKYIGILSAPEKIRACRKENGHTE